MKIFSLKVFLNNWINFHVIIFKPSNVLLWLWHGMSMVKKFQFHIFVIFFLFHVFVTITIWKIERKFYLVLLLLVFCSCFCLHPFLDHGVLDDIMRSYNNTMYYKGIKGSPFFFCFFVFKQNWKELRRNLLLLKIQLLDISVENFSPKKLISGSLL